MAKLPTKWNIDTDLSRGVLELILVFSASSDLTWNNTREVSINAPLRSEACFCFELILKTRTCRERDSDPDFRGCEPSALPLSFSDIPVCI